MNGMQKLRGATLIEVLLFIIIVSVGMLGMLLMFDYAVKNSADPLVRKQAILIAEAMLDEILAKDFTAGGYAVPPGTDRAQFDDVSDYNGYNKTGILALDGTAITGLSTYTVSVVVNSATAVLGSIPANKVKSVAVTVTGGNESITLTGYRTSYD